MRSSFARLLFLPLISIALLIVGSTIYLFHLRNEQAGVSMSRCRAGEEAAAVEPSSAATGPPQEKRSLLHSVLSINLTRLTEKSRRIMTIVLVVLIVVMLTAVIAVFVVRAKNYQPPLDTDSLNMSAGDLSPADPSVIVRTWYVPHAFIIAYLLASAAYAAFKTPDQRVVVLLTALFLLAVYGVAMYRAEVVGATVSGADRWKAFGECLADNLKWSAVLLIAYILNRLCRGGRKMRGWRQELKMFGMSLKTIFRILFPFVPFLVRVVATELKKRLMRRGGRARMILLWLGVREDPRERSDDMVIVNVEDIWNESRRAWKRDRSSSEDGTDDSLTASS